MESQTRLESIKPWDVCGSGLGELRYVAPDKNIRPPTESTESDTGYANAIWMSGVVY